MEPANRINARLDHESARRLGEIVTGTGRSVSLVVREAIALYHTQVLGPLQASRYLGLAGTGRSGRGDVASDVKAHVAEALEAKFGSKVSPKVAPGAGTLRKAAARPPARGRRR